MAKSQNARGTRPNWPCIPVCEEQHFNTTSHYREPIEPYLLGLLLGDGHMSETSGIGITSGDIGSVVTYLESIGADYAMAQKQDNAAVQFIFRGETRRILAKNLKTLHLLGKKSNSKFIPPVYLWGPVEDRWALLQGLMDTDGTCDKDGGTFYASVSYQLIKDVQHLVQSLGGTATLTEKSPWYPDSEGNRVECQTCYNLYIKHRTPERLFRLSRKKMRAKARAETIMYRRVVDVEVVEEVSGRCITVNHPNGLYITDDFIVTHNSHALRHDAYAWCLEIPGVQVYLFRRTFPELERTHILSARTEIPGEVAHYNKQQRRIEWKNSSNLHFCHCQYEEDVMEWLSAELHILIIDEVTTFTEFQYNFLRARVRCTLDVPIKYRKWIPRIVCGSNPGGVGHVSCKARWVDYCPPKVANQDVQSLDDLTFKWASESEGGMLRCYIPATLSDNPAITEKDPGYKHRLDALPEPYRTAYLTGDWNLFMGQAFEFVPQFPYVIPSTTPIPPDAPIYMTYDWGFGAPFSIMWWWVDADGRLYGFAEWYGWTGEVNKGLRLADSDVARGIREREEALGLSNRPIIRLAGHDCFNKKMDTKGGGQGPSTAEVFAAQNIYLTKADSTRHMKIRQFRERLRKPVDGELPMLVVYACCENFIRTIPMIQTHPTNPEEIDDTGEDHVYDSATQVCMARPMTPETLPAAAKATEKLIDEVEKVEEKYDAEAEAALYGSLVEENDPYQQAAYGYMPDPQSFGGTYETVM